MNSKRRCNFGILKRHRNFGIFMFQNLNFSNLICLNYCENSNILLNMRNFKRQKNDSKWTSIDFFLNMDEKDLKKMGDEARTLAEKKFSYEVIAKKYIDLYGEILSKEKQS